MLSRRAFMAGTGAVCAAGAPAGTAAAAAERAGGQQKMRLGCVSWAFRGIGEGPPWDEPIETIGEIGFSGIELIVARAEEFDRYWKEQDLATIRRKLESAGLVCSQFVLFQTAVAGLGSRAIPERQKALKAFEAGCAAAKALGSRLINIVAPWPTDITGPTSYLPRYYLVREGEGAPPPSEKYRMNVPRSFPARQAWDEFVSIMRETTAIAKGHGLTFSLENHTHTFTPTTDGFLRLYDRINDPALGMNLDIGWVWINREYPPLAIYKVADQLVNVHIRDVDGLATRFPEVGTGRMDLEGVIQALRDIEYRGFLTIEQDTLPDQRAGIINGRKVLEKLIA